MDHLLLLCAYQNKRKIFREQFFNLLEEIARNLLFYDEEYVRSSAAIERDHEIYVLYKKKRIPKRIKKKGIDCTKLLCAEIFFIFHGASAVSPIKLSFTVVKQRRPMKIVYVRLP